MALTARFWRDFKDQRRLNLAANTPFHSLHLASRDNGSSAVTALQDALKRIQDNSPRLVFPFVPDPEVAGFQWGPFDIAQLDLDAAAFGTSTELAVKRFQKQAQLEADGKAGMNTFAQLDQMLAFLEIPSPLPSPFLNFDL
jgi:hypothetical protein